MGGGATGKGWAGVEARRGGVSVRGQQWAAEEMVLLPQPRSSETFPAFSSMDPAAGVQSWGSLKSSIT
jgi:hypothetical protein